MSDDLAKQVPLPELLLSVPAERRLLLTIPEVGKEPWQYGLRSIPIGRMCIEAATRIAALEADLARANTRALELRDRNEELEMAVDRVATLERELAEAKSALAEARLDISPPETRQLHDDQFHEVIRLRAELAAIRTELDQMRRSASIKTPADDLVRMLVQIGLELDEESDERPCSQADIVREAASLIAALRTPPGDLAKGIADFIYWVSANEFTDPEHMLVCAEWFNLCGAVDQPMTMAGSLYRKRNPPEAEQEKTALPGDLVEVAARELCRHHRLNPDTQRTDCQSIGSRPAWHDYADDAKTVLDAVTPAIVAGERARIITRINEEADVLSCEEDATALREFAALVDANYLDEKPIRSTEPGA